MDTHIRYASDSDLLSISAFVEKVFDSTVANYCTKEGVRIFKGYIKTEHLAEMMKEGSIILISEDFRGSLSGVIMTKGRDHIALFFVRKDLQGRGVGRALLERLIKDLKKENRDLKSITVNSSPNSVDFYRKLGFFRVEGEKTLHGITSTRMNRVIRS